MKNLGVLSLLFFAVLFVTGSFSSCENSDDNISPDNVISLTEDEKANLLFMREEEKLARDVYLYSHEKYDLNIFNNIASSEQIHMDAVLTIMEKYSVADPASNELGVFTNATLQQLYDNLIAQVNTSMVEALKVGATIEDVDIRDLEEAIFATTITDLLDMYEMLECGSRNHLRAFVSQLVSQGETYTIQFITQEQYDGIIAGSHEHCGM
jgi:hypothetical protein